MTQVGKQFGFDRHSAPAAPALPTLKTAALLVALIVYAAGFVILYPRAASSVAEGGGPALLQFVGP